MYYLLRIMMKQKYEMNMNSHPFRFIDAHHHLWDLEACDYPWLMAKGEQRFFGDPSPIQKNYLVSDFLNESAQYCPEK